MTEALLQLTTIKNLLGRQGGHFLLFGLLTRMEDNEFYLEDLDDKVKLDLSEAVSTAALRRHLSSGKGLTSHPARLIPGARIGVVHGRKFRARRRRLRLRLGV